MANRPSVTEEKGIIAWFAANHVAANLLMLVILVAGMISAVTIRKQTTPDFELNSVQVRVSYLGAAPQEVEEGVVIKVEEAIQDIQGIKRIRGTATEGLGTVTAEVETDADFNEVLNEIKTKVDAIQTFPGLTEKPVIYKQEVPIHVVFLAIYGDMDAYARKALAQDVRNELMQLSSVTQVQLLGDRDYEISIEVSEHVLRQYGLTMTDVSQAVQASSIDLPGGTIRSDGGDILLRTEGQVYTGREFGRLVLRTFPDGTRLTLDDIATIKDGFVETDGYGRFDGEATATLRVLASGGQNELVTAAEVKAYVEEKSARLPDGVRMDIWVDRSHYLEERLSMMISNMLAGALLVFVVLSLFLRMKVAFWVIVGIPVTFFGTLWLMPIDPLNVTINVMSLFGFIVVLGIVVDDAIIIGESIYTKTRADGHNLDNVIRGAKRVALPATFGVLTTMAAFAPLLFLDGIAAPFFESISVVVILCLFFSLIESKLILPAHLARASIKPIDEDDLFRPQRRIGRLESIPRFFTKQQRHVQHALHFVIERWYRPWVGRAVDNSVITVVIFSAVLIVTLGSVLAGVVRFNIFPSEASDFIRTELEMQSGSAPAERDRVVNRLEQAIFEINDEFVAENPDALPLIQHVGAFTQGESGAILFVEMPLSAEKSMEGTAIADLWRERVGEIAGVRELTFSGGDHLGGGAPLSFRLSGSDYEALEAASVELQAHLATYEGVFDIRSSAVSGGEEISLSIKPEAEALGLTLSSLGRQVRQAFYGEEAQRIQRGKDELKIMVRYPIEERRSVADLQNMRIRTPTGEEVPFESVAEISFGQAYSSITRLNRNRTVTVSADIDPSIVEVREVVKIVTEDYVPELLGRYTSVDFGLEGSSQEEVDLLTSLVVAFAIALALIYALIAIPLHSYIQPAIIMSVIPFGFIGAVVGHLVMGKALSMFSLFGLVALSGVVVNDSLIMMDFINRARAAGQSLRDAVIDSGAQRFRAIILTSFTTAIGLMPIMFETSVQAQSVVPMAISVSFGILFATFITLFLIPALYVMQQKSLDWLLDRGEPMAAGKSPEPGST
ncbi:MAG: efflux RND transporter permease subunit [Pseudomonadota bacterium]